MPDTPEQVGWPLNTGVAADAASLRESAAALKSWFDSVSEQQREAMYGFGLGHGYGVEQRAADALDCAFRLAAAAIHAMNATASGLETLAQGIEARQGGDGEAGSVHESPTPIGDAPETSRGDPS